jgi:hypothetical protein
MSTVKEAFEGRNGVVYCIHRQECVIHVTNVVSFCSFRGLVSFHQVTVSVLYVVLQGFKSFHKCLVRVCRGQTQGFDCSVS